jgi:Uma2 family endonuclease
VRTMGAHRAPVLLTIADLEATPDDGNRYELIDGELYVSTAPGFFHQSALMNLSAHLWNYLRANPIGTVSPGIGVIFDDHNGVVPDLVYTGKARLREYLIGGRLTGPPEIAIEILSPGSSNEKRDRHIKLSLYAARGVEEYWILDPENRSIEIHRRSGSGKLDFRENLRGEDRLATPLLPGFDLPVAEVFAQPL